MAKADWMAKVIFLTQDSPGARVIANATHRRLGLDAIVTESPAPTRPFRLFAAACRRRLPIRLAVALDALRRRIERDDAPALPSRLDALERSRMAEALRWLHAEGGREATAWPIGVPRFLVGDMNDEVNTALCTNRNPDLILVFGTRILKSNIIAIPRLGVLNVHTSLLPEYRGSQAEFWQVLNRDLGRAGVTIHVVNEGLDTGDIVAQEPASPPTDIDPWALRTSNTLLAARLLPEAAAAVIAGTAVRRPQGTSATPTYRARDVTLARRIELLDRL